MQRDCVARPLVGGHKPPNWGPACSSLRLALFLLSLASSFFLSAPAGSRSPECRSSEALSPGLCLRPEPALMRVLSTQCSPRKDSDGEMATSRVRGLTTPRGEALLGYVDLRHASQGCSQGSWPLVSRVAGTTVQRPRAPGSCVGSPSVLSPGAPRAAAGFAGGLPCVKSHAGRQAFQKFQVEDRAAVTSHGIRHGVRSRVVSP